MTRDEAKSLLQACTQDEAATSSPEVVEALAMAANDAELAEWFRREKEFDEAFSSSLDELEPPADLRDQLLDIASKTTDEDQSVDEEKDKVVLFPTFRNLASRQFLRNLGSFAAALAVVAFVSVILFEPREATANAKMPEFYQTVRDEIRAHQAPDYMHDKPQELLQFLRDRNAPTPATLPKSVDAMKRTGASILQGRDNVIGVLFLEDLNGDKFRLFIVDMEVPDSVAPTLPKMKIKEFAEVSALTWKKDGKVHALVTHGSPSTLEALRE